MILIGFWYEVSTQASTISTKSIGILLTLAEACRFQSVFNILHTIIFSLWSNIENENVYMFARLIRRIVINIIFMRIFLFGWWHGQRGVCAISAARAFRFLLREGKCVRVVCENIKTSHLEK